MNKDALKTVVVTVTNADATVGPVIPVDMVRYVYRIRFTNLAGGAQLLTIGKRENGAGATTIVDYIQTAVTLEMFTDPDEIKEDSAPLYTIFGGPSRGSTATAPPSTSLVRAVTDQAAGGYLTLWYEDEEAAS